MRPESGHGHVTLTCASSTAFRSFSTISSTASTGSPRGMTPGEGVGKGLRWSASVVTRNCVRSSVHSCGVRAVMVSHWWHRARKHFPGRSWLRLRTRCQCWLGSVAKNAHRARKRCCRSRPVSAEWRSLRTFRHRTTVVQNSQSSEDISRGEKAIAVELVDRGGERQ